MSCGAVRARGWAADIEETVEGEVSIAAPVRVGSGRPVGAIGITGAIERILDECEPHCDLMTGVRLAVMRRWTTRAPPLRP